MDFCKVLLVAAVVLCGCGMDPASNFAARSAADPSTTSTAPEQATTERQIIYVSTIDLVVEDFAKVEAEVGQLIAHSGGYIGTFREERRYGGQMGGHWVLRVPANQFRTVTAQLLELGVPTARLIDAQDITEQYVDLTARLKNKKVLEQRIAKLLDERTGHIKDIIEVEAELGRVRQEVEQLEGKLRYLASQTAMSTITLSAREDKNYIPPQAPGFLARVGTTFSRSWQALRSLAEDFALVVVALTPWLIVAAAVLLPLAMIAMRPRRRRRSIPSCEPITAL